MIKPDRLRKLLTSTIPIFQTNPEKLVLQFDNGKIKLTGGNTPSFEYHYDLLISVADFPNHPDVLFVPLNEFIRTEQSELLFNKDNWEKITFDLDRNNNNTYDIFISVPLTERVIVKDEDGGYKAYHGNEPQINENNPLSKLQIYLKYQGDEDEPQLIFDSEDNHDNGG